MDFKLTTPVVFMIFNRPDTTLKVFERIRQAKPEKLFVIADGARENKIGEAEKVQQCRDIVRKIDWGCEVHLNFAEKNMGCKRRVYSGISWVFEYVEEAIILEDDCLPSMSFFRFCQELLEKYRYDTRIINIGGSNHDACEEFEESYCFSRGLGGVWGWATWKRAWALNDIEMTLWPEVRKKYLKKLFPPPDNFGYVNSTNEFQRTYDGLIDTWDYSFALSALLNHGLGIMPRVNMVRNIGFGAEATHTFDRFSKSSFYMDEEMEFPLVHPKIMLPLNRVTRKFEPAPTQQEFQEEFQLRDNHFKQLIQSGKFSAVIDYFKDTLRNAKFFHLNYVYWLSAAYLMVGDYPHSLQLAEELINSGAVPPQAFTQFVSILLSQKRVEDAFMILDKILSKFQNIDERLKNEIAAIVQANQNILASGKYSNIEKFI